MTTKTKETVLITCSDPIYSTVMDDHSITKALHTQYVEQFTNPSLPANATLTSSILTIINNPLIGCGFFIHFSANPFDETTNSDISIISSVEASSVFVINYSVALFRALQQHIVGCQFHFNKARTNMGAFDIIFKVTDNTATEIFWANVSSGIPLTSRT